MTADCPQDFPYVPVPEPGSSSVRRGYWRVAKGLQRVDGLETSAYLDELADEHAAGVRGIDETGRLLRAYYREREDQSGMSGESVAPDRAEEGRREADLVSQRIVEVLAKGAFSLVPSMPAAIHQVLFQDLDPDTYFPGKYKAEALQKSEFVLNGDSVVCADPLAGRAVAGIPFRGGGRLPLRHRSGGGAT